MNSTSRSQQMRNWNSFSNDAGLSDATMRTTTARGQSSLNASLSLGNSNGSTLRQQQARKLVERQRTKVLKPLAVGKSTSSFNRLCEIGQEFSSVILPDSGTASYRLTHDVSFDEGSRFTGAIGNAFTSYKSHHEESRNGTVRRRIAYLGLDDHCNISPTNGRLEKVEDSANRDRYSPNGHVQSMAFKESPSLSFMKMDDKRNGLRSASNLSGNCLPGTISVQRMSKDSRQSWSHKLSELSISGGGYYASGQMQPGGRMGRPGLVSSGISPTSAFTQKPPQSRDRNSTFIKSRMSSRYGSRFEGSPPYNAGSKEAVYADPCIGASPSFLQRLTELSLLEAETVRYEKSRKVKRKSKQDKDS